MRARLLSSLGVGPLVIAVIAGCGARLQESSAAPLTAVNSVSDAPAGVKERGIGDFPKLSPDRDWPWWRGPSRNGIAAADSSPPTTWSDSQSVIWKALVPGRGHSSPTIVGNRVFLASADEQQQIQFVVAFQRDSGKQLWKTDINQGGFPRSIHPKNTHASPTIACDGDRLFVTLLHHDAIHATALDLEGQIVWQKTLGPFQPKRYEYGYAPSPVIYRGSVIVSAEYDGDAFLVALDRMTGDPLWRTSRPSNISYSTPVVASVSGRDQLLISGADQVSSYDPATGKLLWATTGTTAATCGTMVWDGDIVFASGGFPDSETLAVRSDGSGKVLWRNRQKCYEQSMLAYDGHLYALTDNGIVFCWRADTGQEMWKQRLKGPISASPVFAGGHIYWSNELGTTFVFKPNPTQFELVAENQLGEESFASPAVSGGQLFLRVGTRVSGQRQEYLYCLGSR